MKPPRWAKIRTVTYWVMWAVLLAMSAKVIGIEPWDYRAITADAVCPRCGAQLIVEVTFTHE